jgi:hypothetical protein
MRLQRRALLGLAIALLSTAGLLVAALPASAGGPSYLNPTGLYRNQARGEGKVDGFPPPAKFEYFWAVVGCVAWNKAWGKALFEVNAGYGIVVDPATDPGAIVDNVVKTNTYVYKLSRPRQNASGAWWLPAVGPVTTTSSGKTKHGVYSTLTVWTGFELMQRVGEFGMPSVMQQYWITQTIQIDDVGNSTMTCSGAKWPPPGCTECVSLLPSGSTPVASTGATGASGAIGATGPTGPSGGTGPTGPTMAISSAPSGSSGSSPAPPPAGPTGGDLPMPPPGSTGVTGAMAAGGAFGGMPNG